MDRIDAIQNSISEVDLREKVTVDGVTIIEMAKQKQPMIEAGKLLRDGAVPRTTKQLDLENHGADCLRIWGDLSDYMADIETFVTSAKYIATRYAQQTMKDASATERKAFADQLSEPFTHYHNKVEALVDALDERVKWCKRVYSS